MKYLPMLGVIVLLGLSGCAGNKVDSRDYSGFLGDYSRLTPQQSPSGAPVMRWIDPALDISRYHSVYIERSQFYPKPQPTARISQKTLDDITRYYDGALQREVARTMPLARSPGPGVIVVRPAITAVSSAKEGLRAYEVIPVALVVAAVGAAAGTRDEETVIATEAAFIDGGTNQVLAQVVRKGTGMTLENDSQMMTAEDFKAVLDGWARDMHASYLKLKAQ
ncbi:DUF3313 domain-containing protein [Aquipseudomonas campi]